MWGILAETLSTSFECRLHLRGINTYNNCMIYVPYKTSTSKGSYNAFVVLGCCGDGLWCWVVWCSVVVLGCGVGLWCWVAVLSCGVRSWGWVGHGEVIALWGSRGVGMNIYATASRTY